MVYKIPLKKVKKYPRKVRSKKAIKLVKRFLSKHNYGDIKLDPRINEKIWEKGIQKPPSSVRVRVIEREGKTVCEPVEKKIKKKEKSKKQEREKYEEILSKTIKEGKEEIKKLKSPDYDLLLEVEKKTKDRKGMKQFLKAQT